jgi:hypothetical protein
VFCKRGRAEHNQRLLTADDGQIMIERICIGGPASQILAKLELSHTLSPQCKGD